jgi:hypothetical protein
MDLFLPSKCKENNWLIKPTLFVQTEEKLLCPDSFTTKQTAPSTEQQTPWLPQVWMKGRFVEQARGSHAAEVARQIDRQPSVFCVFL